MLIIPGVLDEPQRQLIGQGLLLGGCCHWVAKSCPTHCNPKDCIALQAPLSMGFSRQEYRHGLPFPSPLLLGTEKYFPDHPNWETTNPCPGVMELLIFHGLCLLRDLCLSFPGGTNGKEPAFQCRIHKRHGLIPALGRSSGGGHGSLLQCSCLENPMDRGAWRATVHRIPELDTTKET